jgi:hypothetical protein
MEVRAGGLRSYSRDFSRREMNVTYFQRFALQNPNKPDTV